MPAYGVLVPGVTLRAVINTPPAVKAAARADDARTYRALSSVMAGEGVTRVRAFARVATAYGVQRADVVAAFWRHDRRMNTPPVPRRIPTGKRKAQIESHG